MEQISLPMRIALAATLAVAALWFVALRPKPVDVDAPSPAATPAERASTPAQKSESSTPANEPKAETARGVAEAGTARGAAKAEPSEAGPATADPAAAPANAGPANADPANADAAKADAAKSDAAKAEAARPATKLTGSKAVMADIEAGRTVVLLFYHPSAESADDVAVRKAVKDVDRRGGKVRVHTASLGKLGQYEAITSAAKITSTPTVLVIDRKAQVRAIEGLTVTREIDAVVDRALKASK